MLFAIYRKMFVKQTSEIETFSSQLLKGRGHKTLFEIERNKNNNNNTQKKSHANIKLFFTFRYDQKFYLFDKSLFHDLYQFFAFSSEKHITP